MCRQACDRSAYSRSRRAALEKATTSNSSGTSYLSEDIQIGYLSAPTGDRVDMRFVAKIAGKRRVVNSTRAIVPVVAPVPYLGVGMAKKVVSYVIPEPLALKVVKGNANVAFPGTRYSLPA